MTDALQNALTNVVAFVPRLVMFLLILLIGWFIAKMIAKAIGKVLERVGFDHAVERGGVGKALAKSEFDASDIIGKLVYYTLMLFVLQLAFGVFGPNPISALLTSIIAFLPALIVAIIIIVVASAIAAAVKTLIEGSLGGLIRANEHRKRARAPARCAQRWRQQGHEPVEQRPHQGARHVEHAQVSGTGDVVKGEPVRTRRVKGADRPARDDRVDHKRDVVDVDELQERPVTIEGWQHTTKQRQARAPDDLCEVALRPRRKHDRRSHDREAVSVDEAADELFLRGFVVGVGKRAGTQGRIDLEGHGVFGAGAIHDRRTHEREVFDVDGGGSVDDGTRAFDVQTPHQRSVSGVLWRVDAGREVHNPAHAVAAKNPRERGGSVVAQVSNAIVGLVTGAIVLDQPVARPHPLLRPPLAVGEAVEFQPQGRRISLSIMPKCWIDKARTGPGGRGTHRDVRHENNVGTQEGSGTDIFDDIIVVTYQNSTLPTMNFKNTVGI